MISRNIVILFGFLCIHICFASYPSRSYSETMSTLRFGQRAKLMKNEPVVNEISEDDVNELSDQIRQLKVLLLLPDRRAL